MPKQRMKGKWIKGNYNHLSADQFASKVKKAGKGVKKPHAIEEKRAKGKMIAWRIYYKPIQIGEFWD